VEGFGYGGDQARRAEDLGYVFDAAIFGDDGFDADGSSGGGGVRRYLRGLWVDAGNELAYDYFFIVIEGPAVSRRHVNGPLDVHCDCGRFEDPFAGQTEKGCFVAGWKVDFEGLTSGRVHLNYGLK